MTISMKFDNIIFTLDSNNICYTPLSTEHHFEISTALSTKQVDERPSFYTETLIPLVSQV